MSAPKLKYSVGNSASTSSTGSILGTDTSVTLSSDTNFQAAPTPGEGMALMDEGTTAEELAYSTGISSGALTIPLANRGLEGTAAVDHTGTFTVKGPLTAGMWNDMIQSLTNVLVQSTGALDTTKVVDKTTAQTLTNKTMDYNSNTFTNFPTSSTDGWVASSDTWTYVSASSFKITGADRTAIFTPGTRLKFTQTTAKYAVVVSSSFSTDTTVTIAVNTDYTIANASITSPYYSYESNPQGYPGWFNYTPTWGGYSASPTGVTAKFAITGRTCFVEVSCSGNGTSNDIINTLSLPANAATSLNCVGFCRFNDNGVTSSSPGMSAVTSGSSTLSMYKDFAGGTWTNSGAKNANLNLSYEI